MHLLIFFLFLSLSQCANAVEATSRQMVVLLEQEIQVGLLRLAAHSLLGSYGAAPSQGKSPAKAQFVIHKFKDKTMILNDKHKVLIIVLLLQ